MQDKKFSELPTAEQDKVKSYVTKKCSEVAKSQPLAAGLNHALNDLSILDFQNDMTSNGGISLDN